MNSLDRKAWLGPLPRSGQKPDDSKPFDIRKDGFLFEAFTVSRLDKVNPLVIGHRSEGRSAVERESKVFSRRPDGSGVYLIWEQTPGEFYVGAIDLNGMKMAVSVVQISDLLGGLAVEVFTADCR